MSRKSILALLLTIHAGVVSASTDEDNAYPPRTSPLALGSAECLAGPIAGIEIRKPFTSDLVSKIVSDKTLPNSTSRFVHFLPKLNAQSGIDYVARIEARTGIVFGVDLWIHLQSSQLIDEQIL